MEIPDIGPHIQGELISNNSTMQRQGKNNQQLMLQNNWIFTRKVVLKTEHDPYLASYTKINSKWITELNVKR